MIRYYLGTTDREIDIPFFCDREMKRRKFKQNKKVRNSPTDTEREHMLKHRRMQKAAGGVGGSKRWLEPMG